MIGLILLIIINVIVLFICSFIIYNYNYKNNHKIKDYVDRMKNEYNILIEKINKLEDFINNIKNNNIINPYQKEMLNKQLFHMKEYANILSIRIEYETNINKVKRENKNK